MAKRYPTSLEKSSKRSALEMEMLQLCRDDGKLNPVAWNVNGVIITCQNLEHREKNITKSKWHQEIFLRNWDVKYVAMM